MESLIQSTIIIVIILIRHYQQGLIDWKTLHDHTRYKIIFIKDNIHTIPAESVKLANLLLTQFEIILMQNNTSYQ